MSKDLLMRVLPDLKYTYLPFLTRYMDVLERCRLRGWTYRVLATHRSYEAQMARYAEGRTAPGVIVSHSTAGRSAHNFGCAADAVYDYASPMRSDYEPANYRVLGEEAKRAGLEWGGDTALKEWGHVQWPGMDRKYLRQLDTLLKKGGLNAVWDLLDEESGELRSGA